VYVDIAVTASGGNRFPSGHLATWYFSRCRSRPPEGYEAMSNAVHGHEVMHFMLERGGGFTRESLLEAVKDRFGADARFYTCSADDMTADQLIDFLAAKGKFVEQESGFNTQPGKICAH
jgi:probable metal-binding protein